MKEGRVTRCHTYKDVSKDGEDLQLEDTSVLQYADFHLTTPL